jgi:[acyl-carrier-protein] S-malonyltransferase
MRNTAFVFSGQGSQYPGMGRAFLRYPFAAQYFAEAGEILGKDLLGLCCDGTEEELRETDVSQPAILVVSYLRYLVFCETNAHDPVFYAGHSLGEYTALLAAGVLDFHEAVRLIGIRAACMKRAAATHKGTMAAVVCEEDTRQILSVLRKLRKHGTAPALGCINSARQLVLSGTPEEIGAASDALRNIRGIRIVPLQVQGAFHSPLMADAAETFSEALAKAAFHPIGKHCAILSNVTGVPYPDTNALRRELLLQLTHPVQWQNTVQYMAAHGADTFVEFGARPTLTQLIQKEVPSHAFAYSEND